MVSSEALAVPVVLDTDIGGDADDALAVTAAARSVPGLAAVVTSDEISGQRARFARHLLDLAGRPDVVTAAGADLGADLEQFVVQGLVPDDVPAQRTDVVDVVREVCAHTAGPVRWVGMGPLTNLAQLVDQAPDIAARLQVTQMGGALKYRHPERAEHNVRQDVAAARSVFAAITAGRLQQPSFVASEVTWNPQLAVTGDSPIYQDLASHDAPAWARLLVQNLDRWFERFHPATLQHDALTLTAALNQPFVHFDVLPIRIDDIGRTTTDETTGVSVRWSLSAESEPFMNWLATSLGWKNTPTPPTTTRRS